MIDFDASVQVAASAAQRLCISVEALTIDGWPLLLSRTNATATMRAPSGVFFGHGGGGAPDQAGVRAAMECLERHAQFRRHPAPPEIVAPWDAVHENAISPLAFGLYDRAQYATVNFPCTPFTFREPIEWISVTDLLDGSRRLAPIEFVYPNAPLGRRPFVRETSSGTAAHVDPTRAALAGLCELVERDAAMLLWHRLPQTAAIPVNEIPVPELREELSRVRSLGYVVVVASLEYDLNIPCFLVVALQGDGFAYGLGCHPDSRQALAHAIVEVGQALASVYMEAASLSINRSFGEVQVPDDHYRLYHRGPRHHILRQMLARTLTPAASAALPAIFRYPPPDETHTLRVAVQALAAHGFRAYACDVTPDSVQDTGVRVVRTLVPGLVPLHFGFDRMRLGCERLTGAGSPGRLCNLLPHFLR